MFFTLVLRNFNNFANVTLMRLAEVRISIEIEALRLILFFVAFMSRILEKLLMNPVRETAVVLWASLVTHSARYVCSWEYSFLHWPFVSWGRAIGKRNRADANSYIFLWSLQLLGMFVPCISASHTCKLAEHISSQLLWTTGRFCIFLKFKPFFKNFFCFLITFQYEKGNRKKKNTLSSFHPSIGTCLTFCI